MKAAVYYENGGPEVLKYEDVPDPKCHPKGVVIRTLLKDIPPDALGTKATLFHEHLSFEWARVRGPNGRGTPAGGRGGRRLPLGRAALRRADGRGPAAAANARGVLHHKMIRVSRAGNDGLPQAGIGIDHRLTTFPGEWIGREEDAGHLCLHHPLHHPFREFEFYRFGFPMMLGQLFQMLRANFSFPLGWHSPIGESKGLLNLRRAAARSFLQAVGHG